MQLSTSSSSRFLHSGSAGQQSWQSDPLGPHTQSQSPVMNLCASSASQGFEHLPNDPPEKACFRSQLYWLQRVISSHEIEPDIAVPVASISKLLYIAHRDTHLGHAWTVWPEGHTEG